jgi:hypothetical protein
MISLDQCRKFVPKDPELADDKLERIREILYAAAEVAVTECLRETGTRSPDDPDRPDEGRPSNETEGGQESTPKSNDSGNGLALESAAREFTLEAGESR